MASSNVAYMKRVESRGAVGTMHCTVFVMELTSCMPPFICAVTNFGWHLLPVSLPERNQLTQTWKEECKKEFFVNSVCNKGICVILTYM